MLVVLAVTLLSAAAIVEPSTACDQGSALFRSKAYRQSQEPLWECILSGSPDKDRAYELALTYRETKDYDAGIARAEAALKEHPRSTDILYIASFLQFRRGNYRKSLELASTAYRIAPGDWRVHHVAALDYVVLEIKPGAIAEFKSAIALNPKNAELRYQLARMYFTDNRVQDSIDESMRALEIFPEYPEVYDNLGLCYQALADTERANAAFERSITLGKKYGTKDEWPFLNYAAYLIKLGKYEPSIPLLQQALDANPQSAKARYYLGRAMRQMGRNSDAINYLQESIRLDPNDPAPYYELGTLLIKAGETERGKRLLERFQTVRKATGSQSTQP